ncbi:MAG: hypothetical protein HZA81_00110 [Candidatus Taylorbacteria bacterium]|nr:hypothetical protein [Candidatus Taylorbacteria bacterium]
MAQAVREYLLSGEARPEDQEHMESRLRGVIVDWISTGNVEALGELHEAVSEDARERALGVADRRGLSQAELFCLRGSALIAFAGSVAATGDKVGMLNLKMAPHRKAIMALSDSHRPWTPFDFSCAVSLSLERTDALIKDLEENGYIFESDTTGESAYSLTPHGWRMALYLKKMGFCR